MLLVVRLLTNVPVPGVDHQATLASLVILGNPLLRLLDLFSGGGLATVLERRPWA